MQATNNRNRGGLFLLAVAGMLVLAFAVGRPNNGSALAAQTPPSLSVLAPTPPSSGWANTVWEAPGGGDRIVFEADGRFSRTLSGYPISGTWQKTGSGTMTVIANGREESWTLSRAFSQAQGMETLDLKWVDSAEARADEQARQNHPSWGPNSVVTNVRMSSLLRIK